MFEVNLSDSKDKNRAFRMLTLPEYLSLQKETDPDGRKIIYYISERGQHPSFTDSAKPRGSLR